MAASSDGSVSATWQRIIDKNATMQILRVMLDGSGLKVRALKSEFVITNPDAPDKGEIRIGYASGYVSWRRVLWEHWGPLQGFLDEEKPTTEHHIGADKILSTLCETQK
jgi:hypothetical protein